MLGLGRLKDWYRRRLLEKIRLREDLWHAVCRDALARFHLDASELERLRELASLFLHYKTLSAARGSEIDDYQCAVVAAIACLPILELDLGWYDGWVEVIVYPDSFINRQHYTDEAGVVHQHPSLRGGESWDRGPVILSWADLDPTARYSQDPGDLAIHEFAHKLDQLNGSANGEPPLHREMDRALWASSLQQAFDRLQLALDRNEYTPIDPYGAESPAEFFSVTSEYFFTAPAVLYEFSPALYAQLKLFYRQDPLQRFDAAE